MASRNSKGVEILPTLAIEATKLRAFELLCSWLSPSQREQWLREKKFTAVGSDSGQTYTLDDAQIFNVHGAHGANYCAVLPCCQFDLFKDLIADRLLAQKIAIETDEANFLSIANPQQRYTLPQEEQLQ